MPINAGGGGERLGKAKNFDTDGVAGMSAAEIVAMMNDTETLMSSSVNGNLMQTGAGRDADGTIDRSPPPTAEVSKMLFDLKRIVDAYGLDMTSEFRNQGASQYGTFTKSRFNSVMTTTFGVEKDFYCTRPPALEAPASLPVPCHPRAQRAPPRR